MFLEGICPLLTKGGDAMEQETFIITNDFNLSSISKSAVRRFYLFLFLLK